ncbi:MAG: peroxide stress protein YaaA [Marinilabiliales bacterium]|nr:MAG: peroxide stress protein YaaA [Marinilabiliales bacterium]
MITIISPAKRLDFKSKSGIPGHTEPRFTEKAAALVEDIRQFSPTDLAVLMNVSDDIANFTFEHYMRWKNPFDIDDAKQALFAFMGDVYQSLDAGSLSDEDIDFAQKHLRILSGLYGILRPLDLIQPYRLEMGTKITTSSGGDLYAYWSPSITAAINEDLGKHGPETLINLASREYFRAVDTKKLTGEVITPVFKEYRNGRYQVMGMLAKRARGMMARFIIKKRIVKADEIKLFNEAGYSYDDNMSSASEWVFTR